MNTGTIANRYAKAFFAFSEKRGESDAVINQVETISSALSSVPLLRKITADKTVIKDDVKNSILATVIGQKLEPALDSFLNLVIQKGRTPELPYILQTYKNLYYHSRNIRFATITTAVKPTPQSIENCRRQLSQMTGSTIVLNNEIDPSLLGGFKLRIDDIRKDASVRRQLDKLRKEFLHRNSKEV